MNSFILDIGMNTQQNKVVPSKNKTEYRSDTKPKIENDKKDTTFEDMLKEKGDTSQESSVMQMLFPNAQKQPAEGKVLPNDGSMLMTAIQGQEQGLNILQLEQMVGPSVGHGVLFEGNIATKNVATLSSGISDLQAVNAELNHVASELTKAQSQISNTSEQQLISMTAQAASNESMGKNDLSNDFESASQNSLDSFTNVENAINGSKSLESNSLFSKTSMMDPLLGTNAELDQILSKDVKDKIFQNIAKGNENIEIHLTPKNLGTLDIKIMYDAGKTIMSIICSDNETMKILAQNASELGQIIESNTKMDTVVIIDEAQPDYLQDESSGQKGEYSEQQQDDDSNIEGSMDSSDFLHMLRLGLV